MLRFLSQLCFSFLNTSLELQIMKYIVQLSRAFVGILFILSGLVKLNDPMGFAFKLDEYFGVDVLNLPFLQPLALGLALFIVIFEVVLGVALLLGYQKKIVLWLLFSMIVFFTFLTFYSAYFNKVTDCGCFGDAVPLTPWQSFGKDIILLILIAVLLAGQRFITSFLPRRAEVGVVVGSIILCSFMGYWVLNHLPLKDFRVYAEGKSIVEGMKHAEELGLEGPVYENIYVMKKGDETLEITSTQYMDEKWWEKPEWVMQEDQSKSIKIKDGYEPPVHDFAIGTEDGDITELVLAAENYLLVVSYKLTKADVDGFKKIANVTWELEDSGIPILALTSTSGPDVEAFRHEIQAPFDFGTMDETTLKTIIRSNPGLVWLKKGVVFKKWHYNDVPSAEELKALR
jgi:uncharacterized membrane protein YphA (DoxX/SURF4 family)